MLRIHYLPGQHWVPDDEAEAVNRVAQEAINEARKHIQLSQDLYLLVHQVPEPWATRDGGYTLGPQVIRWDIDPSRGLEDLARARLRNFLLHEAHHAARLTVLPGDHDFTTWINAAVFEGLATAFQCEVSGHRMPWHEYNDAEVARWYQELGELPLDAPADHWRFQHPDGRQHVLYKVGCWIAEKAMSASGRTAGDLVGVSHHEVLALAGLPAHG